MPAAFIRTIQGRYSLILNTLQLSTTGQEGALRSNRAGVVPKESPIIGKKYMIACASHFVKRQVPSVCKETEAIDPV